MKKQFKKLFKIYFAIVLGMFFSRFITLNAGNSGLFPNLKEEKMQETDLNKPKHHSIQL